MRNHIKIFAISAMLAMPVSLLASEGSWYNPKSWFNKDNKTTSTTVTGNVDSIKDQVVFKTLDGQTLLLIGKKASKVGECGTTAKIRVFGNVYKPSDKYPTGALQVRNYRVLEAGSQEETTTAVTTVQTSVEEPTPEPYEEAAPEVVEETPKEIVASNEEEDAIVDVTEEQPEEPKTSSKKTYVVQSGDTLGKISQKLFGTTTKWKKIAESNGITNPKHLRVGMTLNVPEL